MNKLYVLAYNTELIQCQLSSVKQGCFHLNNRSRYYIASGCLYINISCFRFLPSCATVLSALLHPIWWPFALWSPHYLARFAFGRFLVAFQWFPACALLRPSSEVLLLLVRPAGIIVFLPLSSTGIWKLSCLCVMTDDCSEWRFINFDYNCNHKMLHGLGFNTVNIVLSICLLQVEC